MGFLKSCIAAALLVTLHACADRATQTTKQDEPAVTTQPATSTPPEATPAAEVKPQTGGAPLPHFAVRDINGNTLDLQSYKGKKLLVNLWATWCPPCRAEMPSLDKLYQAVDKEKVQFVLLSLDNDFGSAKKYVQQNNLNLPIYYPAGDLPGLFEVNGIPATFIFDETGTLISQREGMDDYDTKAYRELFGAVN